MREEPLSFKNPSGESIAAAIHHPSEPELSDAAVIVCHGFGGSMDLPWIRELCNALARDGFVAARFDFSGCGKSEGRFEDLRYEKEVADLRSCMDEMEKRGSRSFGLIGHSMGGAVVILEAARDARVKAIVDIAGVALPAQEDHVVFVKKFFQEALGRPVPSEDFISSLKDVNVLGAASSLKAALLVIHGDRDERVNVEEGRSIFDAAPDPKKMIVAMGSGHRLSEDPEFLQECIEDSVEWMRRFLRNPMTPI